MENPIMGLLADRLKKAQQFAAKPFGYENPPVEMLMNLLGVPAVQQTMERMAYGEPLTTGRGMTTKPRPEAVEAALAVAPVAGLLAKTTKGLPVGASIKNVGDDLLSYRGSHTAPDRDFGAPLHDLTGGGQMYPADVYSSKAAQIYGGGMPYDQKAFSIAQQYKDKPDALVTIYRAVPKDISNSEKLATLEKQMAAYMKRGTLPKDAENYSSGSKWYDAAYERREALRKMPDEPSNQVNKINAGDWVTLTREYAKDHGESALNGEYKIISQKVKAKDVFTNADSIHEFGYQPQKPSPIAPRQEALDTAQRNAALPVEEGGLGLPKNNTPEMRAEAMGYNTPAYHGTTVWEAEDGRKLGDIEAFNRLASTEIVGRKPSIDQMGIWASDRPDELGAGMYSGSQGAIYPLLLRMENPKTTSFEQMARTASNLSTNKALGATEVPKVSDVEPYRQLLKEQGYDSLMLKAKQGSPYTEFADQTGYVLLEPSQVRSRNAAFDPKRRNEADILAGVLPLGLLADEEQRKKLYELMPSLLGE
jgi:hypothetical protein